MTKDTNTTSTPKLWNPGAAAAWSLLFTAVFGALLQYKNWKTLGEKKEAKISLIWAISILVFFLTWALIPEQYEPLPVITRRSQIILLALWYFIHGKKQIRYIKENHGKDYERKQWASPLLIGFGCLVSYFLYMGLAQALIDIIFGISQ